MTSAFYSTVVNINNYLNNLSLPLRATSSVSNDPLSFLYNPFCLLCRKALQLIVRQRNNALNFNGPVLCRAVALDRRRSSKRGWTAFYYLLFSLLHSQPKRFTIFGTELAIRAILFSLIPTVEQIYLAGCESSDVTLG